jgi:hypothetical protein
MGLSVSGAGKVFDTTDTTDIKKPPATGYHRDLVFVYRNPSSSWEEVSRGPADVPN